MGDKCKYCCPKLSSAPVKDSLADLLKRLESSQVYRIKARTQPKIAERERKKIHDPMQPQARGLIHVMICVLFFKKLIKTRRNEIDPFKRFPFPLDFTLFAACGFGVR